MFCMRAHKRDVVSDGNRTEAAIGRGAFNDAILSVAVITLAIYV